MEIQSSGTALGGAPARRRDDDCKPTGGSSKEFSSMGATLNEQRRVEDDGLRVVNSFWVAFQRGMPSKRVSSACVDYVPDLCTHRPSLLPIEWLSEAFGLARGGWQRPPRAGKFVKLGHLEEVKVVTRSP